MSSLKATGRRDTQKQRLYDAEAWASYRHSGYHFRQVYDNTELQGVVDTWMRRGFIRSRWGQRKIYVSLGRSGAHAKGGNVIVLGAQTRNPWIMLHEIAHCLIDNEHSWHGPEFAGVYLFLVHNIIGDGASKVLREGYRKHRVRYNNNAIPKPDKTRVVTKAQEAAQKRRRMNRPVTPVEARQAAQIIRRAVNNGLYGPPGRKPRTHAQATARALEEAGK